MAVFWRDESTEDRILSGTPAVPVGNPNRPPCQIHGAIGAMVLDVTFQKALEAAARLHKVAQPHLLRGMALSLLS